MIVNIPQNCFTHDGQPQGLDCYIPCNSSLVVALTKIQHTKQLSVLYEQRRRKGELSVLTCVCTTAGPHSYNEQKNKTEKPVLKYENNHTQIIINLILKYCIKFIMNQHPYRVVIKHNISYSHIISYFPSILCAHTLHNKDDNKVDNESARLINRDLIPQYRTNKVMNEKTMRRITRCLMLNP